MLEPENSRWSVEDAVELYGLKRWGLGYFGVDPDGFVTVSSDLSRSSPLVRIWDIVQQARRQGLAAPLLIRFPRLIHSRSRQIHSAFDSALREFGYRGSYRCFYPVKVNQHWEVVDAAMQAVLASGGGLETGSKAELLSAIATTETEVPILCNGFKDKDVIEMAVRASQLGRSITIIIEKSTEIDLLLEAVDRLGVRPRIGVRVKLAAKSGGHWQSSGGAKSKFGLTISELNAAIGRLKDGGLLDCLQLLHFHPGSQITNVREIKSSLIEIARIYVGLVQQGVPLKVIDVGGGLAVDYTGLQSEDSSSMNYTLAEYANDVIHYIKTVCDESSVPHPDIISESGRALVAHHSLLVVSVMGTSRADDDAEVDFSQQEIGDVAPLRELQQIYDSLDDGNLAEDFHDAQTAVDLAMTLFSAGVLTLQQRALAERLGWSICNRINQKLECLEFIPRELQQLKHQLADTYFGNFSVFQALPDSWALDQVFPVVPIHRLGERPNRQGVLSDITCDSDGSIQNYVVTGSQQQSLPLHDPLDGEPYLLGIFLVGAYQEALADEHNLLGKFNIVNCYGPEQMDLVNGSSLLDVLQQVNHSPNRMADQLSRAIGTSVESGAIDVKTGQDILHFFDLVKNRYTYLDPGGTKSRAGQPPAWHVPPRNRNVRPFK
ncbi:MAG: biosynthetic arginine decarboxylase [Mariniblastus sp.]|nr:biosynthetic arginine decarboxylase [Mariniblastus sp.]